MIFWLPIADNEKPILRGEKVLPVCSAATIGNSVVLRMYGGRFAGVNFPLTTIPFPTRRKVTHGSKPTSRTRNMTFTPDEGGLRRSSPLHRSEQVFTWSSLHRLLSPSERPSARRADIHWQIGFLGLLRHAAPAKLDAALGLMTFETISPICPLFAYASLTGPPALKLSMPPWSPPSTWLWSIKPCLFHASYC
jgi:hypothetical protein